MAERLPAFEGLRAVAALCVLTYHCAIISSANQLNLADGLAARLNIGVTVFFLVSGFLLYCVARRESGTGPPDPWRYLQRRALRIIPAYWAALAVLAAVPTFALADPPLSELTGEHWWVYALLLQVYSSDTATLGLGVAWTLCVEVSFYLLLPLYAAGVTLVLRRFTHHRRVQGEFVLLALLALASAGCRWYWRPGTEQYDSGYILKSRWPPRSFGLALEWGSPS